MKPYQISNRAAQTLENVAKGNPGALLGHLVLKYAGELIQPAQVVMDLQPADGGTSHTQKQWIGLYNSQKGEFKGKRMVSAPDVIGASKFASPEALTSLQGDCGSSWVLTSSHISYQPDSLAGIVTHNYQSTVASPKVISLDEIPVYQEEPASKVVETTNGLSYLRALADDMYAKPAELLERLVALSQIEPKDIVLCTPNRDSRRSYTERAVGFVDGGRRFRVVGFDGFGDGSGHSRGVLISPRSRRAKN